MSGSRSLTPAQLEQRKNAPVVHGMRSEARIAAVARSKKRWLLRSSGLNAADLDAIGRGYLQQWARCEAQATLLDRFMQARGPLKDETTGEPWPFTAHYISFVNGARNALTKLETHLRATAADRDPLGDYLASKYAAEHTDEDEQPTLTKGGNE